MADADDYADVVPVPLDDGECPPASIAFSQHYTVIMGVFRALYGKKELSARALALTEQAITLNPANYTAWAYRRQCIDKIATRFVEKADKSGLSALLAHEFTYTDDISADSPKNYQLWGHRRWLTEFHLRMSTSNNSAAGSDCCVGYSGACAAALTNELIFTRNVLTREQYSCAGGIPQQLLGEKDWFGRGAIEALRPAEHEGADLSHLLPAERWSTAAAGEREESATRVCDPGAIDAKNYHAWAHRQWALAILGPLCLPHKPGSACVCGQQLPVTPPPPSTESVASPGLSWPPSLVAHELGFSQCLLADDVRNNSAWNHRWFVLRQSGSFLRLLQSEMEGALRSLSRGPSLNDSAWAYARGLLTCWLASRDRQEPSLRLCDVAAAFPALLPTLVALRDEADPGAHIGANEILALLLEAAGVKNEGASFLEPSRHLDGLAPHLASQLAWLTPRKLRLENADADMARTAYWTSASQ